MVAKVDTKRKKGPGRPPKAAAVKINNIPATDDLLAMYKDMPVSYTHLTLPTILLV